MFHWIYEIRNRGLFMIGVSTGGCISDAEQERHRRYESSDGARHAQSSLYGCRFERQNHDAQPAKILCAAGL